jgi:hypothetical protein
MFIGGGFSSGEARADFWAMEVVPPRGWDLQLLPLAIRGVDYRKPPELAENRYYPTVGVTIGQDLRLADLTEVIVWLGQPFDSKETTS